MIWFEAWKKISWRSKKEEPTKLVSRNDPSSLIEYCCSTQNLLFCNLWKTIYMYHQTYNAFSTYLSLKTLILKCILLAIMSLVIYISDLRAAVALIAHTDASMLLIKIAFLTNDPRSMNIDIRHRWNVDIDKIN